MEDFSSPSEKTPLITNNYQSQTHEQSLDTCVPCPSAVCSKINAKIGVFCVNCGSLGQRDWRGEVIGKGLHGSLTALCARIRATVFKSSIPLIKLWTICSECYTELGLDYEAQMDTLFNHKYIKSRDQEMVVRLLYNEVEDIVSSKIIMMEGWLVNANTIKTARKDGKWKTWQLWNPPMLISDN
ncbi:hypothetical protein N431DRAFT_337194 [Stipitochalara longipes BDJ]|nr:hypothetical protein N431DRAFT_337194 [Stipitochalara longipes BDJ]